MKAISKISQAPRSFWFSMILVGEVVWLTVTHPVWIFNAFLLARMGLEFFMPGYFVPIQDSQMMKRKQMPTRAPVYQKAPASSTRAV